VVRRRRKRRIECAGEEFTSQKGKESGKEKAVDKMHRQ